MSPTGTIKAIVVLNKILPIVIISVMGWVAVTLIAQGREITQLQERSITKQEYSQLVNDLANVKAKLDSNALIMQEILTTNRMMLQRMANP